MKKIVFASTGGATYGEGYSEDGSKLPRGESKAQPKRQLRGPNKLSCEDITWTSTKQNYGLAYGHRYQMSIAAGLAKTLSRRHCHLCRGDAAQSCPQDHWQQTDSGFLLCGGYCQEPTGWPWRATPHFSMWARASPPSTGFTVLSVATSYTQARSMWRGHAEIAGYLSGQRKGQCVSGWQAEVTTLEEGDGPHCGVAAGQCFLADSSESRWRSFSTTTKLCTDIFLGVE